MTKKLSEQLLEFHNLTKDVLLDGDNPFTKSKYPTIANVIKTIKPTLYELGIVYTQNPTIENNEDVLKTRIFLAENPSDFIESTIRLLMPKNDMQQLGGAITYARRYALVSLLGIIAHDDDGTEVSEKPRLPTWDTPDEKNVYVTQIQECCFKGDDSGAVQLYREAGECEDKKRGSKYS